MSILIIRTTCSEPVLPREDDSSSLGSATQFNGKRGITRLELCCFVLLVKIHSRETGGNGGRGGGCPVQSSCSSLGTVLCEGGISALLCQYSLNTPFLSLWLTPLEKLVAPFEVDGVGSGTLAQAIL